MAKGEKDILFCFLLNEEERYSGYFLSFCYTIIQILKSIGICVCVFESLLECFKADGELFCLLFARGDLMREFKHRSLLRYGLVCVERLVLWWEGRFLWRTSFVHTVSMCSSLITRYSYCVLNTY
jgi:hypothetical protein